MALQIMAHAKRDDGWWRVTIPEIEGIITQTRRLDQIPTAVIKVLQNHPDFKGRDLDVQVRLDKERQAAVDEVLRLRDRADKTRQEASSAVKALVQQLAHEGLSYRDIGTLLQVSYQYVQTLAKKKLLIERTPNKSPRERLGCVHSSR